MLIEHDLFRGVIDRVQMAIDRIIAHQSQEHPYVVAYSGGKDSDCVLKLTHMSGVPFTAHYNWTTVDPPEVYWHVKTHPEVTIIKPKETMWQLVRRKRMPPTRLVRYCCDVMKEQQGDGKTVITGIRAEESKKRSERRYYEPCKKNKSKLYLHPIFDWSSKDVWQFIKEYKVPYCKVYDEGWKRLGCVMCPYSNMKKEAKRWPKIAEAWHRAILRCYDENIEQKPNAGEKFKSGEEMWQWWLSGKGKTEDGGLFT